MGEGRTHTGMGVISLLRTYMSAVIKSTCRLKVSRIGLCLRVWCGAARGGRGV